MFCLSERSFSLASCNSLSFRSPASDSGFTAFSGVAISILGAGAPGIGVFPSAAVSLSVLGVFSRG